MEDPPDTNYLDARFGEYEAVQGLLMKGPDAKPVVVSVQAVRFADDPPGTIRLVIGEGGGVSKQQQLAVDQDKLRARLEDPQNLDG